MLDIKESTVMLPLLSEKSQNIVATQDEACRNILVKQFYFLLHPVSKFPNIWFSFQYLFIGAENSIFDEQNYEAMI